MIQYVLSLRNIEKRAHYDVTFEWKDIFSDIMHAQIKKMNCLDIFMHKVYCKIFKNYKLHQNLKRKLSVYFVMYPKELRFFSLYNGIPIFLDIWTDEQIDFVIKKTQKLKLFYVTSLAIYEKIKKKFPNMDNVRYFPLSVSDIYYSDNFEKYVNKPIDVIQIGRTNPILHEYMMRYVEKNPETEYVYAKDIEHNSRLEYVSTTRGNLGILKNRKDFIAVLSSAKVSLVSTPAMDNSRKGANGINFPTPRFYESTILGCDLIGRYEQNEEIKLIGIDKICHNVTDYEDFEKTIKKALFTRMEDRFNKNKDFIVKNLTSQRAAQVNNQCQMLQTMQD